MATPARSEAEWRDAGSVGPQAPKDPESSHRSVWRSRRLWLGLFFSVVCLVLAFHNIDLQDVSETLRETHLGWLAAAALVVLISAVVKALRWRLLFRLEPSKATPTGFVPVGVWRLTSIWLAGTALNLALPAPRSGDLARAYLVGEAAGVSKSLVLGTIAAEKLLDVVMLAVCFVSLLPFVVMPRELAARRTSVIGVAALLVAAVFVVLWQRHRLLSLARRVLARLPAPRSRSLVGSLERAVQGLDALRSPRRLFWLSLITVVIWVLSAYTNYLVFLALGLPPSWVQSFFLLVVLQAGVAVPSTPGKVGIFQVLCRWALGLFGIPATMGLAYGILLYLAVPVLLMIVGAVALVVESWRLGPTSTKLEPWRAQGEDLLQDPTHSQL